MHLKSMLATVFCKCQLGTVYSQCCLNLLYPSWFFLPACSINYRNTAISNSKLWICPLLLSTVSFCFPVCYWMYHLQLLSFLNELILFHYEMPFTPCNIFLVLKSPLSNTIQALQYFHIYCLYSIFSHLFKYKDTGYK